MQQPQRALWCTKIYRLEKFDRTNNWKKNLFEFVHDLRLQ